MTLRPMEAIPIIDVFAGSGGLGEGFASLSEPSGGPQFRIALSIEKEAVACRTLRLRAIRRILSGAGSQRRYLELLRGEISRADFHADLEVRDAAADADLEVLNAELGKTPASEIDRRITAALDGASDWVLIGGPPCQAYSLAGRARRANDQAFAADEKHFLYREYLRILRAHAPPVFVMENVKGLLSSHHGGVPMFERILKDLSTPARGLAYEIRPLVRPKGLFDLQPDDYLIESERFGIPQTRHRVILLGVRSDLACRPASYLREAAEPVTVGQVLHGMPRIRSRLSRGADSVEAWHGALRRAPAVVKGWGVGGEKKVVAAMRKAATAARELSGHGGAFIPHGRPLGDAPKFIANWLAAPQLGGVIQHEARQHMSADLVRYMFASTYAQEFGLSPKLHVFPRNLLPDHRNAFDESGIPFPDRFRVQCADMPSSTIVSHIAKDGHYYIHPDPSQCRSLTLREAARLQTFPEDYFFEGNRTEQYVQVGNAVPPLLARQIAEVVSRMFSPADGLSSRSTSVGAKSVGEEVA